MKEEQIINRFTEQMLIEIKHNSHKGSILNLIDFNEIVKEIKYHKSKIFMAIRAKNNLALKEYIADTANNLLALGNLFGLYDNPCNDQGKAYEMNKTELIKEIDVKNSAINQSLI